MIFYLHYALRITNITWGWVSNVSIHSKLCSMQVPFTSSICLADAAFILVRTHWIWSIQWKEIQNLINLPFLIRNSSIPFSYPYLSGWIAWLSRVFNFSLLAKGIRFKVVWYLCCQILMVRILLVGMRRTRRRPAFIVHSNRSLMMMFWAVNGYFYRCHPLGARVQFYLYSV